MARALSLFYPLVLPHAIGCPDPLLDQALLDAAGEFCRDTFIAQETSTQDVVADQADYDVDTPTGQQLACVMQVWHADTELDPAGMDEVHSGLAVRGSFGTYEVAAGTPTKYHQKNPSEAVISLWPVPDTALTDGLAVRAAFEPTATTTTLADVLYDTYAGDIAAGAIAYLLSLPGQAFSNPVLGRFYATKFEGAKSRAGAVARFGRIRRSVRVQARSPI